MTKKLFLALYSVSGTRRSFYFEDEPTLTRDNMDDVALDMDEGMHREVLEGDEFDDLFEDEGSGDDYD